MSRTERFFYNLQQDFKLLIFTIGVFSLFRLVFIAVFSSYLVEATGAADIEKALFYGLRMDLKSAGIIVFFSFWCCTAASLLADSPVFDRLRLGLGSAYIVLLSILFGLRLPYYELFRTAVNEYVFTIFRDDWRAMAAALAQQYNLPVRLAVMLLVAAVLCLLLNRFLRLPVLRLPRITGRLKQLAAMLVLVFIAWNAAIFASYGGRMSYGYDISWENAALTKDEVLNEAVMNDIQMLIRGYRTHARLSGVNGIPVDTARIREYGAEVAGRQLQTDNVDDYFRKEAKGAKIARPQHIFLLIGESYANWALLPEYAGLNIATGMKDIIAREDALYVPAMLPNGPSTIGGVNGILTGLTEVSMYVNYQQESFRAPYATALAPQLHKLGYKVRFWYCGPSSWERVKDFALAQGVDEFYACGDFPNSSGNIWGCDDKYMFQAVRRAFAEPDDKPTFDIILNVSNHLPYTVDLAREGFHKDIVTGGLEGRQKDDADLINKLGHFWYADKLMSGFINEMEGRYPDSLFLIVGDHADRFNVEDNPGLYRRYGIPFIVYGQGLKKDMFPPNIAGSQIDIMPTLFELIAPKGFTYYSAGRSFTEGTDIGYNFGFWITPDGIGRLDSTDAEALPGRNFTPWSEEELHERIDPVRALCWWRIKYGQSLVCADGSRP